MILSKFVQEALLNHIETADEIKCNGEFMFRPQGFRQTMLANIKLCQDAGFRMFLALKLEQGIAVPCIVLGYAPKNFSTTNDIQKKIADVLSGENQKHENKAYIFYKNQIVSGNPEKFGEIIPYGSSFPVLSSFKDYEAFLINHLGKVVHESVIEEGERRNVAFDDVFDDMFRVPDSHLGEDYAQYANPGYWRSRMELIVTQRVECDVKIKAIEDRFNALRTLIAGRIQKDGSKTLFKAKHLVDLPNDFAEKLEELLEIGK